MNKKYDKILDEMFREKTIRVTKKIMGDVYGAEYKSTNDESDKNNIRQNGFFDFTYCKNGIEKKVEVEITKYHFRGQGRIQGRIEELENAIKPTTVCFPERKLKNIADVFLMVDYKEKMAFIIKKEILLKYGSIITKTTKYCDNENFIEINCKHGRIIKKINDKWIKEV